MKNNATTFADEVIESTEGQLRLALLGAGLARKFNDTEYTQYLRQLTAADPDPNLSTEISRISHSTYDQTPEIALDTTSKQLLWAATFLHSAWTAARDKKNFSDTPFFRHIINQPVFQQELLRYAHTLSDHFDRNKTRIRWGTPLSWFYFSPSEKIINLDPFHSLVFGMPRSPQDYAHSRGPAYHEVGHAILSTVLPAPFEKAIDRLKELSNKSSSLTVAEQEEVIDNRINAVLWGQFYNLAEDNVVNRFAIILGRHRQVQSYDYAESLKYIYALINQSRKSFEDFKTDQWSSYVTSGRDFLGKIKASSALEQFNMITKILGLAVPVNEGLFNNDQAEWQKSGVDWAAFMPSQNDAEKLESTATLLAEGDGKPNSVSYQQPYLHRVLQTVKSGSVASGIAKATEKFFRYLTTESATIHSQNEIEYAATARNVIIEQLWEKYVLPLLPQIKAEIKQQLQKQQQSIQDMADQIPGPPSSGMGTPGDSKQDDPQQKKDQQTEQKTDDASKDTDLHKQDEPSDNGSEEESSVEQKEQKNDDGNTLEGDSDEQDQNQKDSSGKGSKEEIHNSDKKEQTIGNEPNSDPGQIIKEIIQDAERQEASENQRQQQQEGQLQNVIRQAQHSMQDIKFDFPEGDWSNYQANKQRLAWLTNIFIRQLEEIRKKQIERQVRRGRQLEMLPDGGEMDRLDMEAQFRLVSREGAQAPLRPDDFKRFIGNKIAIKLTTPQIILLIDGSGSMDTRMNRTLGALPIDIAISTGVALYEATNQINLRVTDPKPAFECYAGIWGPNNPDWLTWPGIEPVEAGKSFDRFRNGLQSVTNLAPALAMIPKKLSVENSTAKNIGATHLFIVSDGDIQDPSYTYQQMGKLIENVGSLTVDILLISAQQNPKIIQVFHRLKAKYPTFNYGVHDVDDIDQLPLTCLRALRQRMTQEIMSIPRAIKAAEFKRVML